MNYWVIKDNPRKPQSIINILQYFFQKYVEKKFVWKRSKFGRRCMLHSGHEWSVAWPWVQRSAARWLRWAAQWSSPDPCLSSWPKRHSGRPAPVTPAIQVYNIQTFRQSVYDNQQISVTTGNLENSMVSSDVFLFLYLDVCAWVCVCVCNSVHTCMCVNVLSLQQVMKYRQETWNLQTPSILTENTNEPSHHTYIRCTKSVLPKCAW